MSSLPPATLSLAPRTDDVPLLAGARRPRSASDVDDGRPLRRGLWRYDALLGCVMHKPDRCPECAAFTDHVQPALETLVYTQARDLNDRAVLQDAYEKGWDDAETRADHLEKQLLAARRRVAALEEDLRSAHTSLGRADDALEAARSRIDDLTRRRGWPSGGGGHSRAHGDRGTDRSDYRAQGERSDYRHDRHDQRSPRNYRPSLPPPPATDHNPRLSDPQATRTSREPTDAPVDPGQPAGTAPSDPATIVPTVREPQSVAEVDEHLALLAEGPSPQGIAVLGKIHTWVVTAHLAQANKAATQAQFHLLQKWRAPEWAKITNKNPTLNDTPDDWARYYNKHRRSRLPRGVRRITPGDEVDMPSLRGHLTTAQLIGTDPGQAHLRQRRQKLLAGLFMSPQAYQQKLDTHGVVPAAKLAIGPLPLAGGPHAGGTASQDKAEHSNLAGLNVRTLTIHCASVGITTQMVSDFLAIWAHNYLGDSATTATAPSASSKAATTSTASPEQSPAVSLDASLPADEDRDTEMVHATDVPLPPDDNDDW